jgi:hypothetical protein
MHTDRHSLARPLLALVVLAAFAGACTGAPQPTPIASTTPAASIPQTPVTTPVPGDVTGIPQRIIDAVLADASSRTGVAVGDIAVLIAKAVTWPNGALGCPQPGMMYTEMIEPGYQVVVEAAGQRLDYRGGSGGALSLCENPPASG